MIAGKRVLITGGGGSIGGQLARRVAGSGAGAADAAGQLRVQSLPHRARASATRRQSWPTSATALRCAAGLRASGRRLVFHAAALKQVPLVEAFPSEGVLTNVGGLRHVADAARSVGADLIFVSTDKAVDPSGVMGATKRLGELYCQALDRREDAPRPPGAARQRAGLDRLGDADVRGPARRGRAAHRHRSGRHALLLVDPAGGRRAAACRCHRR